MNKWRKQEDRLRNLPLSKRNVVKRMRAARWPLIETKLKDWVNEMRRDGLQVSGKRALQQARIIAENMDISFKGSPKWVYNFMRRNNFVRRAVTSVGQHLPENWEEKLTRFQDFVIENKSNLDLGNIGNMDEATVSFDMPSKFTFCKKGNEDVKITTTGHEKCNFTVALAVLASGKKLPPYIIFKRKTIPKGNYPASVIISANLKGWMTSNEMKVWIDKIWNKRPGSIFNKDALLLLDSAPGHRTDELKVKFNRIKTIPAIIPGGLTKLLQPLDISVNKSFKSKLRELWEKFMMDSYKSFKETGDRLKKASYEEIVSWIDTAWKDVPEQVVKNGFKKTNINFYSAEENCKPIDEEEDNESSDSSIF